MEVVVMSLEDMLFDCEVQRDGALGRRDYNAARMLTQRAESLRAQIRELPPRGWR